MIAKTDLTATDLMVMEALCQSMVTPSAITLAADLWDPKVPILGADPVGFVQWVLDSLSEKGLVKFRLKEIRHSGWGMEGELQGRDPYEHFATQIRLTRDGWELMGYPHIHAQVFTRLSTSQNLPHTGDRTNFRRHSSQAEGGVITTETFAEHRVNFPHHIHMYYEDDGTMTIAKRPYMKVTPQLEAELVQLKARDPNLDYSELAEELDVPERTVKYILTELPRLRRNSNEERSEYTQKQRILWALEAMSFKTITDLRKVLGRADTAHDIVHALHDLHTEGKVQFTEKSGGKEPFNISITARGETSARVAREAEQASLAKVEPVAAEPEPIEKSAEDIALDDYAEAVVEALELDKYPLLDQLLDREIDRKNSDHKGLRYIEAAELIRETDPETAALLDAKAAESNIPFPSPLEAEYLRYVEAHPRFEYVDEDGRLQK